jgi:succinate dehydrogenase flavin-adding protein (antitoxin of CptAB toxin-antitoxin module)
MSTNTATCIACGASAVQPPYPQLCMTCRAHGISWVLRRINAECDTLSQQWGSAVAALSETEQARFAKLLEARSDLDLPATYRARQEASTAFWKRVAATIAKGDAFGDAVAMWKRHQDRDADRLTLRIQQAWLERTGQAEMDI